MRRKRGKIERMGELVGLNIEYMLLKRVLWNAVLAIDPY